MIAYHRVVLESAFILHRRPYGNTSLILECLTLNYGRVSIFARSARGLKSRYKGKLELFSPFLISWSGRASLKSLGKVELNEMPVSLEGKALLCGFYLNELVLRLLPPNDPDSCLFYYYKNSLETLSKGHIEISLRSFEKRLLERLGYGLPLEYDIKRTSLKKDKFYQYIPEQGFASCNKENGKVNTFSGKSLLALREEVFSNAHLIKEMKHLMRLVLRNLLGSNPLKTQELLR
ncbi:DNA repair protein RecO [Coxiella endosymbiont of Amblyomma americanum]|uniref:DNA repair protein RecO n=1 Tax=Coxiella endosymbiont of Amblyomma americanum TaxID=325775 RepID=UPI0005806F56|nr:DNA repair protein RecO [Coxiella endosymbiont of Amblyomma americanum]AJC50253.1 DNA recombination protein RecO [Coxiella endosymbiont of Amblyomma americanum]AUJ58611.1 DNA repair protein RecO [Coxiella-like endosymbiont of Amblyomma americanum]